MLCYPGEVSSPGVYGLRLDLSPGSAAKDRSRRGSFGWFRRRRCFIQFCVEERRCLGLSSTSDSRLPRDVRGRNLDLCGVHHIAASVSSALVAASTQRAAVAQLVATAELERDDVVRLCAVRSHAVLVVKSHAADRAVDDAAGLFRRQHAPAPSSVLTAGRPSHDPLAVCARSVVSPAVPPGDTVGGCLGTSIARAVGWVQAGVGWSSSHTYARATHRVVCRTHPLRVGPMGGRGHIPGCSLTRGCSLTPTRVLVRRVCA